MQVQGNIHVLACQFVVAGNSSSEVGAVSPLHLLLCVSDMCCTIHGVHIIHRSFKTQAHSDQHLQSGNEVNAIGR